MAIGRALSIDIRGMWSPIQAQKVLERLESEFRYLAVEPRVLDITNHSMSHRRVIIHLVCKVHDVHVDPDSVCASCIAEFDEQVGHCYVSS